MKIIKAHRIYCCGPVTRGEETLMLRKIATRREVDLEQEEDQKSLGSPGNKIYKSMRSMGLRGQILNRNR